MQKIKNFMELTRAYALLVTFSSCFIIYAFAHNNSKFNFVAFFTLVFALCLVHLGANLFDDYIDVKNKLKQGYTLENMSFDSFVPKAMLIRNGVYSLNQVRTIINILFSVALGIGISFAIVYGWQVLLYMLFGGLLTLFYPISARYGLSEIVIGLIYGPLMITGGYFALTSSFNSSVLLLSFAIFFATLTLLHADNIMDWEFDIKEGKRTLAIMSGNKQNAIGLLSFMMIMAYSIVVIGVLIGKLELNTLYVFLTLPIMVKLIKSMKEYIEIKDVQFKPRWYWGFFENWKAIQEKNIAFYMFRFYLARNFSFFFALFAMIGMLK